MRQTMLGIAQLILAAAVVQSAEAQVPAVSRGARVRVTVPGVSPKPLVGVVDSVGGNMLTLRTRRDFSTTMALSQVTRLEISRGRKRPTWSKTAPLWLTASTGGVGALVGYATTPKDDFFGPDFGAAILGGLGGVLGLLVGTSLAFNVREDTWEPVPVGAASSRALVTPSVWLAPGKRAVTIGIHGAF